MRILAIVSIRVRTYLGGAAESSVVATVTYHGRVDEGAPAAFLLEKRESKGYDGRSEENYDELILELLENELPNRGGRLVGDSCTTMAKLAIAVLKEGQIISRGTAHHCCRVSYATR